MISAEDRKQERAALEALRLSLESDYLTPAEIENLTGYKSASHQLRALRTQGFFRARRGTAGGVLLMRNHYFEVVASKPSLAPTDLYRHFDADGRLLYVGISLSVVQRLKQHQRSHWSDEIASVTVTKYATRDLALQAEADAIKNEKPLHNVAGGTAPRARRNAPARPGQIKRAPRPQVCQRQAKK